MSSFQSHIGELTDALIPLIKGAGITENVYVEHGPEAVNEVPDDFVLITYPLTVTNKGPFQKHTVRVEFVCKDMPNKRTDIHKLEEVMVNPYLAMFPIVLGRCTLRNPYIRLKGFDGLGHTSWTVQCSCLVNTTDKYPLTTEGDG